MIKDIPGYCEVPSSWVEKLYPTDALDLLATVDQRLTSFKRWRRGQLARMRVFYGAVVRNRKAGRVFYVPHHVARAGDYVGPTLLWDGNALHAAMNLAYRHGPTWVTALRSVIDLDGQAAEAEVVAAAGFVPRAAIRAFLGLSP